MNARQVLLTCAGGFQGLTLLEELRNLDNIEIHVANNQTDCLGRYFADHFLTLPSTKNAQDYIDALKSYVTSNSIDLVIPATPHDLKILSSIKNDFDSSFHCLVAVSNHDLLTRLLDKNTCYEWLLGTGIQVQHPIFSADLKARLPVFGRTNSGWGGTGAVVVRTSKELEAIQDPEAYLWTPLLTNFVEYSVDFCINRYGNSSPLTARERLSTVGGFAVISREATVPETIKCTLEKLIKKLALEGGLGLFNVQVLKLTSGEHYVSDINPRVGTSATMAQHSGNNLCAHLLELPAPSRHLSQPITILRKLQDIVIPQIKIRNIKAIVFDLDDTLIPHKAWIMAKVRHVARKFITENVDAFIEYAHFLLNEGGASHLYDNLCEEFCIRAPKKELIDAHRDFVPETLESYPEALSILSQFRGSYRLALLTDNPVKSQNQKLELFKAKQLFDSIILTNAYNLQKPDPLAFFRVVDELGVSPSEVVMVGDNYHRDILGALNAGFAHGFLVQHDDRMFNTAPSGPVPSNVTVITSLRELKWYLSE